VGAGVVVVVVVVGAGVVVVVGAGVVVVVGAAVVVVVGAGVVVGAAVVVVVGVTQCPPEQIWPAEHVAQTAPPAPHALVAVPGWQVLPLQQPFGQLALVHTHCPLLQVCPASQAWPQVPQLVVVFRAVQVPLQQP
jgi:hypothetical protein